ncbi:hypothetical protein Tco_0864608 [Tanacetum coccineum]
MWWKHHGEAPHNCNNAVLESSVNNNDDNYGSSNQNINDMLHDVEHNAELDMEKLQQLFIESEKPLFNKLLELFNKMLPKDNELPTSTHQAKKLMCRLRLEVQRIDSCPKDCILYRKWYKDLHKCPVCKVSRYKDTTLTDFDEDVTKNGLAAKVLWYLPIIPRLKQLYSNLKIAKLLRWHAEDQKINGKIRHVADASQWKNIDNHYTNFGAEIRNIRFELSSDGINPFGNMRLHLLKEDIDLRSEAVKNGYYRWMAREDCAIPTNVLTLFSSISNDGGSVIADSVLLLLLIRWVVGPLSWELPIVNLQEDTWECGFYVRKWVLDFVLKYQHSDFPNILSEIDAVDTAWFSLWHETD